MSPQVKEVVNYLCQLPSREKISLYKLIGDYYKAFLTIRLQIVKK